jgi:hypothetical protein
MSRRVALPNSDVHARLEDTREDVAAAPNTKRRFGCRASHGDEIVLHGPLPKENGVGAATDLGDEKAREDGERQRLKDGITLCSYLQLSC